MQVIPRSHDNGYSAYVQQDGPAVFNTQIDPNLGDDAQAVDCTLAQNITRFTMRNSSMVHSQTPVIAAAVATRCVIFQRKVNGCKIKPLNIKIIFRFI